MVKDTKSHGADQLVVQLAGQGLEGTSLYWQEPMMAEDARQAVDSTVWTAKIVGVVYKHGFALTGMVRNSKQMGFFALLDQSVFRFTFQVIYENFQCPIFVGPESF